MDLAGFLATASAGAGSSAFGVASGGSTLAPASAETPPCADIKLGAIAVGGFAAAIAVFALLSWLAVMLLKRAVPESRAPRWLVLATRQIAARPAFAVLQVSALAQAPHEPRVGPRRQPRVDVAADHTIQRRAGHRRQAGVAEEPGTGAAPTQLKPFAAEEWLDGG